MKTSHANPFSTANSFLPRKPTRRPRLPHRSSRHPMPSNNQNTNTPTPSPPNPSPQHQSNPCNHNHILAIAQLVHSTNTPDPAKLFPSSDPSDLPDALSDKTRDQLIALVENLQKSFDKSVVPFPQENNTLNFLAVLASEINFLKKNREQRDSALAQLNKARAERKQVERNRQRLVAESKSLTKQIQQERARRTRALERKPQEEANLENEKRVLDQQREQYHVLRENLEQAKLGELDVRRQLDRLRLKIAAMRGEMIIPTVDKLSSRQTPKWLGDFDESLISGESDPKDPKNSDDTPKTPSKPDSAKEDDTENHPDPEKDPEKEDEIKPDVEMEAIVPTEDIESPDQSANDDLEFDESSEETEFRLLKNRLAMVEMEAEEWKQCVEYQRQQVRLITRSTAKLEEELAKLKHGGGSKGSGGGSGRGAGKSGSGSAKATTRLRAAIRASLPPLPDTSVRKPIRKSRKGQPKRALVPELG